MGEFSSLVCEFSSLVGEFSSLVREFSFLWEDLLLCAGEFNSIGFDSLLPYKIIGTTALYKQKGSLTHYIDF